MKNKFKPIPIGQVKAQKVLKNYRETKRAMVLYLTYTLMFPDGDVWMKQTPMVNELAWNLQQMIAEKKSSEWKERARRLWHKNECHWIDNLGVEHLMRIEEFKRPAKQLKWGVSKEGLAEIKTGITGEELSGTKV